MGLEIGYGAAGLAGLLSFLSPCILPIVPFYLCYLAGLSFEGLTDRGMDRAMKRRVVLSSLFFACGILTIFIGLGAAATTFGQQVRAYSGELRWAAAAVIFVLGLHFLGVFRINVLMREARIDAGERRWGLFGAYLVGLAFAFGWTPCVGPVLATILFTASGQGDAIEGALLLAAYGVGMTAPFVLAALFVGPFITWAQGFRRHLPVVEKVMGGALVVFAVLIATSSVNVIAEWMLQIAPDIGVLM
ncbi:MAG: cytochrome c biogenesis protein CcdA [Pseudomonadota bacterium]